MSDISDSILYLSRKDVERLCAKIDSVAVMGEVFKLHRSGGTHLPDEAYMGWKNPLGEPVRSLNMPGYVGGDLQTSGTKIINGNIANPTRGIPRANGLTLVYDPISVRPICIMEGAYISSLRTASVSALAAELVKGPEVSTLGIIGAGVLAQAHIEIFLKRLTDLQEIRIFDLNQGRIEDLYQRLQPLLQKHEVAFTSVASAEEAIRPAQLIVPATTTTTGYIPFSWLQPGAILVNVSLDDALPEVVYQANTIIVDDWDLVKNDPRRLLGRMYRDNKLIGPDDAAEPTSPEVRKVDAHIGDLVLGTRPGRTHVDDIILVNPFGLAIEDVAIAGYVYKMALEDGSGLHLER